MINKRLQENFNCSDLFGGITVILLGDCQQVDPVTGTALHTSAVDQLIYDKNADRDVLGTPRKDDISLFI